MAGVAGAAGAAGVAGAVGAAAGGGFSRLLRNSRSAAESFSSGTLRSMSSAPFRTTLPPCTLMSRASNSYWPVESRHLRTGSSAEVGRTNARELKIRPTKVAVHETMRLRFISIDDRNELEELNSRMITLIPDESPRRYFSILQYEGGVRDTSHEIFPDSRLLVAFDVRFQNDAAERIRPVDHAIRYTREVRRFRSDDTRGCSR